MVWWLCCLGIRSECHATRHADVPWWNQFEKLDSTWVWVTCLLCHLRIFPSYSHRSLPTSTMASLKLLKLSFNELMTRREIISITSRDKIKKVGENFHQFSLLVSWNFIRSSCFYFAIFKAINVFKDCFPYFSHACTMRDEIRENFTSFFRLSFVCFEGNNFSYTSCENFHGNFSNLRK